MSTVDSRNNSPIVSVIMPVFNSKDWLPFTLRSLIDQTFPDWELIAVDDGSSDGSIDYLRTQSALDSRMKVYRLKTNLGPAGARNEAIKKARG